MEKKKSQVGHAHKIGLFANISLVCLRVFFFFFPIALHGIVLTDLTASSFCLSFMEEAFPTGINSYSCL